MFISDGEAKEEATPADRWSSRREKLYQHKFGDLHHQGPTEHSFFFFVLTPIFSYGLK
jgi:hypothetical protein